MPDPHSPRTVTPIAPGRMPTRLVRRHPVLALSSAFLAGIVVWGGFNTAMESTNDTAFCISCHEMAANAHADYERTTHYSNAAGVRAGCADCHVPKDWVHMTVRKIRATNELAHKLLGTIDTREKFLERRPLLAKAVWEDMRASDSRECRNCHDLGFMKPPAQSAKARTAHAVAKAKGHTCIDCHKGVMHALSEELRAYEHEQFEQNGVACALCHTGMTRAADQEDEQGDWDW